VPANNATIITRMKVEGRSIIVGRRSSKGEPLLIDIRRLASERCIMTIVLENLA
jgi:hypothetical protein